MGRKRNYSPKVLAYIEKHCGEGSLDWMRGELAERFGIRLDYSQIKNLYSNHKFHAKPGAGNRKQRTFPPDVAKYIVENSQGVGSQEMADRLRELFGIECTREKIRYYRRNHGITSGVDTKFIKGQTSHNKGQAAPLHVRKAMEPTMFKKGNRPHNAQPVGTRVKNSEGYWKIKIAEPKKWQLLSRYEWERIHGEKLKANELVLFLDHNPDNFSPDNLVKLTRAELARLNQDQLRGADPDLNMAAVNIARLKTRAKDAEAKRKKGRPKKATVEGLMAKAEQATGRKERPNERPDDIHNDNGGAVHPPGGSRKEREGGRGISQGKEQSKSGHQGRKAEIHQGEDQGKK